MITFRPESRGGEKGRAQSQLGRMRLAIVKPASCTKRRLLGVNIKMWTQHHSNINKSLSHRLQSEVFAGLATNSLAPHSRNQRISPQRRGERGDRPWERTHPACKGRTLKARWKRALPGAASERVKRTHELTPTSDYTLLTFRFTPLATEARRHRG